MTKVLITMPPQSSLSTGRQQPINIQRNYSSDWILATVE
jgi:hypothetical protein